MRRDDKIVRHTKNGCKNTLLFEIFNCKKKLWFSAMFQNLLHHYTESLPQAVKRFSAGTSPFKILVIQRATLTCHTLWRTVASIRMVRFVLLRNQSKGCRWNWRSLAQYPRWSNSRQSSQ